MSKITLDNNWEILNDQNNWELHYRNEVEATDKKTGEKKIITQKDTFYYPSLPLCLKRYTNETLKSSNNLEDVLRKLEEVEILIKSLKV